jgi:hypothetical protein
MMTLDYTAIALALIGMLSGWATWWLDRRKHRQEVEGLKADNRQKDLDLSKDYVTEWRTFIAEPLQREVCELRSEVAQLRHAIQAIEACPHRDGCPVVDRMQRTANAEV